MADFPLQVDSACANPVPVEAPNTTQPLPAFDPAAWLAEFERNGGWWVPRPEARPGLGRALEGYTEDQTMTCCRMFKDVTTDPDKRTALREHLAARLVSLFGEV